MTEPCSLIAAVNTITWPGAVAIVGACISAAWVAVAFIRS
jgi:hypothetical protein